MEGGGIIHKLTAVGYYGDQLQRLSNDLQGLAFNLHEMHSCLQRNAFDRCERAQDTAARFMNLGGSAAKLRSQLAHVLGSVEQLAYTAESVAPKTD